MATALVSAPDEIADVEGASTTARKTTERKFVRTTIVLPLALDQNLEIYCAREGMTKNDAVKEMLAQCLEAAGLQPHLKPKHVSLKVTY